MKGVYNRIVSLALAVLMLFSLLYLTSCNRKYDEEEVVSAAKELLKTAEMLNIVYYGSGIEYFDSDEEIGYYRKANPQHLEALGFKTVWIRQEWGGMQTVTSEELRPDFTIDSLSELKGIL